MEDGMIYVQGVAAILSFQDLLTALVHVLSSVHLRLGVLQLSLYLDDISVYERFNLVLSALGFNEGFDVCLPIYNLISPLPWLQHQKQRFECRP